MTYTLPEREAIIRRIELAEMELNSLLRTVIITTSTSDLEIMANEMEATIKRNN